MTPTAYEILAQKGMKYRLAQYLGENPKSIYTNLKRNLKYKTKVKLKDGINGMLGTSYNLLELFPLSQYELEGKYGDSYESYWERFTNVPAGEHRYRKKTSLWF